MRKIQTRTLWLAVPAIALLFASCQMCVGASATGRRSVSSGTGRARASRTNDDVATRIRIADADSGYATSPGQRGTPLDEVDSPAVEGDYRDRPMSGSTGGGGGGARAGNCTQCGNAAERDAKRNYRLESIKADILRKLHLRSPPNVTGRRLPALPHIQRFIDMHSVHQSDAPFSSSSSSTMDMEGDGEQGGPGGRGWDDADEDRATTMKVIQVSKPAPIRRPGDRTSSADICYFPLHEIRTQSQITDVVFGVYVKPIRSQAYAADSRGETWLLVYMLTENSRYLLRRKKIMLTSSGTGQWFQWTIKIEDFQHWITTPDQNYGLQIQGSDGHGDPIAVVTPQSDSEEPFRPYMQVQMSELTSSRPKRTTEMNCDERSSERRCCRYPLTVDFDAFHWDWVIVPKSYSAYYCSGECPYLFVQQYGHSQLSQLARPEGSGGPCCSPRKLSAISMLYYDEHMNIIYGRLPAMVVDRCGCS